MKPGRKQLLTLAAGLLAGAAYLGLAYATPRAALGPLLALFALAALAYWWLAEHSPLRTGLLAALLLRLLWLPATPALSDDFYRFRWDGLLVAQGLNPYQHRPDELVADSSGAIHAQAPLPSSLAQTFTQLYPQLNSPHYHSVYPPFCQAVFGLAARLSPDSEAGFVLGLRLVILAAEAGSAWLLLALLPAWGWPRERALLYLLHPLVVVEGVGNLHFEAVVVFFVLLALRLLVAGRWQASAGALALGVATKLLPLLALPLLVRRLGGRRFAAYAALLAGGLLLSFVPFLSTELLLNIGRSLRLYFRSFEFNAGLYYLLRALGYQLRGYNEIAFIGPALAALGAAAGLVWAWREKRPDWRSLPTALLLLLTAYYLCATTVHPWYLSPLIALSVFTSFRYPLAWGALAVLSYAAYSNPTYTENPWLLGLEYGLTVAVMLYDAKRDEKVSS